MISWISSGGISECERTPFKILVAIKMVPVSFKEPPNEPKGVLSPSRITAVIKDRLVCTMYGSRRFFELSYSNDLEKNIQYFLIRRKIMPHATDKVYGRKSS